MRRSPWVTFEMLCLHWVATCFSQFNLDNQKCKNIIFTSKSTFAKCKNNNFTSKSTSAKCTNYMFTYKYTIAKCKNQCPTSKSTLAKCKNTIFTSKSTFAKCTNDIFIYKPTLSKCKNHFFTSKTTFAKCKTNIFTSTSASAKCTNDSFYIQIYILLNCKTTFLHPHLHLQHVKQQLTIKIAVAISSLTKPIHPTQHSARAMAKFEALLRAQEAVELADKEAAFAVKRPRLTADARVSVKHFEELIHMACTWKNEKDLHSLICPPPSSPKTISWSTQPVAEWMVKASGIIYDYVVLAPNTKIWQVRHAQALKNLVQDGRIQNKAGVSNENYVDNCDILIRILLGMFRDVKKHAKVYDRVMSKLGKDGQRRMKLVLDAITIPADFEQDPAEASPLPVYSVPVTKPPSTPTPPKSWGSMQDLDKGTAMLDFPAQGITESKDHSTVTKGSDALTDLGFPTQRLQSNVESEGVSNKSHTAKDCSDSDDEALLQAASAFVPQELEGPPKRNKRAMKSSVFKKPAANTTAHACVDLTSVDLTKDDDEPDKKKAKTAALIL